MCLTGCGSGLGQIINKPGYHHIHITTAQIVGNIVQQVADNVAFADGSGIDKGPPGFITLQQCFAQATRLEALLPAEAEGGALDLGEYSEYEPAS